MDDKYKEYLQSPQWKDFRKRVFEHYGKKCRDCNRTKSLHIHHLTYKNIFHEEIEDVVPLCEIHHAKIHGITLPKQPQSKKKKRTHIQKDVRFKFKKKNKGNKSKVFKEKKPQKPKNFYPALDALIAKKMQREANRMRITE